MHDLTVSKFTEMVIGELEKTHDGVCFNVNEVTKANDVSLTGLTIRKEDAMVAPTIYMEDYIKAYEDGKSIEEIADAIWECYEGASTVSFELPDFFNYQEIAERIRVKVLGAERNSEYLEGKVTLTFGDLKAVFLIEIGEGTIVVTEEMAAQWNRTAEDLLTVAMENAHEQGTYEIMNMADVLANMMGISPEDLEDSLPGANEAEHIMYVISNKSRVNGAGAILDLDLWKEFAKDKGNLYILPSSIHELIAVPDYGKEDAVEELTNMVHEVNSTQVAPGEILSETVYYYDQKENTIMIAATKEPIVISA